MDYAALISLTQTLNQILDNDENPVQIYDDSITVQMLQSLQEKVSFLLSFVKGFPEKATMEFERRITDTASKSEHIIDSFLSSQLLLKYIITEKFCPQLQVISRRIRRIVDGLSCCYNFKLREDLVGVSLQIQRFLDEIENIKNDPDIEKIELSCAKNLEQLSRDLRGLSVYIRRRGWKLQMVSVLSCYFLYGSLHDKLLMISAQIDSFTYNGSQLLHQKLDEVSQEIDKIVEEVKKIEIIPRIEGTHPNLSGSARARPYIEDIIVEGFQDDLIKVLMRVCGESSKLEVIPIVGMGGIGKTTLARHIYNHKLIVEAFDFRAFATISQEYVAQEILLQLLSIKDVEEKRYSEEEYLIEVLHKRLIGRRYLIILDDVWKGEAWDAIRRAFPKDNKGSRIVLTSRNMEVASYVDSSAPLHQINLLDDDQSWNLFQKKIYGEESCPPELEEIGRYISRKCKGLPLAIVVIAGVLSSDRTPHHWKNIADNTMYALSNCGEDIFELLSLSYINLPHYLKPCFLYLGAAFPEGYRINAARLIWLLTAEGFIEPNASKSPEEVAEEYLEDLVRRNMVLVERKYDKIKYCTVHDVIREWCVRKAQEECFFTVDIRSKSKEATVNLSRLAIHRYNEDLSSKDMIDTSQVRTIMLFKEDRGLMKRMKSCLRLRVLDAIEHNYYLSQTEIEGYFRLRYIAMFHSASTWSFPTISRHPYLQTLILDGGYRKLPVEIWGMHQLRHVVASGALSLETPSASTINEKRYLLQNLQTLYRVRDLKCSTEIVSMMPSLKTLGLIYWGFFSEVEEAVYQLKNLGKMTQLKSLRLCLSAHGEDLWNSTHLSEELAFPFTLTNLNLEECRFPWKSMTIIGSLPKLEVLKLGRKAFAGEEWETRDGEFCRLNSLIMKGVELERWIVEESTHFPILKSLKLKGCDNLREIPNSIAEISTLELIQLENCGSSVRDSAKKIKNEQQDIGNDLLKVRILRS